MNQNIFFITSGKIWQGNTAGSARMVNYARALVLEGWHVYFCAASNINDRKNADNITQLENSIFSFENLPFRKQNKWVCRFFGFFYYLLFLHGAYKRIRRISGEKIFFLYPSTAVSLDFAVVLYLKFIRRHRVFYEINELRVSSLGNQCFVKSIKGYLEKMLIPIYYVRYRSVEWLTPFYDGLIVISTTLETYFKPFNKNILRVPILAERIVAINFQIPVFKKGEVFRICFAGSLSAKKEGFATFYSALSKLVKMYPHIELHLYGAIDKTNRKIILNDLVQEYRLENIITYHGCMNSSDLKNEFRKFHLLVLPRPLNKQTYYGFSTKLTEYMVSGVPVLLTKVGDNSIFFQDGVNSFCVEPDNANAITQKIVYVIENYSKLAQSVAQNAFLTVQEHFAYHNYNKELNAFLVLLRNRTRSRI